jgi:HAE1 family hydrophobic/amphiphilic exporter-1
MWFTQISLKNPVLATMVMLLMVVLGVFSLRQLPVEQFPNVDYPIVIITTQYPGVSPSIVESEVTRKIEEAVNSVAEVRALLSNSYQGLSMVTVVFQLGVDAHRAAQDVRERIAQIRPLLRSEVKAPSTQQFDPDSRPVWSVAITGDAAPGEVTPTKAPPPSATDITDWADRVLKKRLENVRGVGSVNLVGAMEREIHIDLIPSKMEVYGIAPEQVLATVQSENQDLPLGELTSDRRTMPIRIMGRMARPEDFGRIIVSRRGAPDDAGPVYLDQVAQIQDSAREPDSIALYDSQRTVLLTVQKTQNENTIEVTNRLNAVISAIAPEVPPGLHLSVVQDNSRPIRVSLKNVNETLIQGALLTVLIVFLFLNSWRSTVITGLTLPLSIFGTFFFMQLLGFSINLVTLVALSLCVGFLIDDAIVVRENIVRHLQMGKTPHAAALEGTREIGLAVLATTSSIVAVFLPVGYMQGVLGQFFHSFGLTIVVAVLLSMFVSFTLDPMLSSIWHDPSVNDPGPPDSLYNRTLGRLTGAMGRASAGFAWLYLLVLRWALAHRLTTVALAVAIFISSVLMLPLVGTEFISKADFSETNLAFYTPPGTSIQVTEAKAREVAQIIRSYPETRHVLTTINSGGAIGKNSAEVYIRLTDRNQRRRTAEQFSDALRRRLQTMPGITVTQVGLLEPVSGYKSIDFTLQGYDQVVLERIGAPLRERLLAIPGLVDLDSNIRPDSPDIEVRLNRNIASSLGLSARQIGASLRTMIAGQTAGNWRAPDGQTYDVIVRVQSQYRDSPQDLQYLPLTVAGADGQSRTVPLSEVSTSSKGSQIEQINRRALLRQVWFSASTRGRSTGEVLDDIQRILKQTPLPPGYEYVLTGSARNMKESFQSGMQAFILGIIFVYIILASQFRSFVQPLALMTSLPLTLIGVVLTLLACGTTLSIFSIIGIVTLIGLVTKNAILLVDFANRSRAGQIDPTGKVITPPMPRDQALLTAAQVRLRPILMTTLAMLFGMLPLAFSTSEGSEQRAPLGQAVTGGVITASVLTLVIVPVVYSYLDDLTIVAKRWWSGLGTRR